MKRALAMVAVAASVCAGPAARAEEAKAAPAPAGDHVEHFGLTLGGAAFGSFYPRSNERLLGGGISGFVPLIRHELELQVAVDYFRTEGGENLLPIDAFLRRPLYVSRSVEPYVAGGPRLELLWGAPKIGGGLALGVDLWLGDRLGVVLEAQANLMGNRTVTPEAGGTAGLVLGL
ncbi:MAG: hypothetical protein JNL38_30740 [Myxococcales bacterium]|jgi:hypothetical protein|nr:hypothetical protein [Myxococcales bacterium]